MAVYARQCPFTYTAEVTGNADTSWCIPFIHSPGVSAPSASTSLLSTRVCNSLYIWCLITYRCVYIYIYIYKNIGFIEVYRLPCARIEAWQSRIICIDYWIRLSRKCMVCLHACLHACMHACMHAVDCMHELMDDLLRELDGRRIMSMCCKDHVCLYTSYIPGLGFI